MEEIIVRKPKLVRSIRFSDEQNAPELLYLRKS